MQLDHIGIVVRSLDRAVSQWEEVFGYRRSTRPVDNTRQKVKVVFLEKEGSTTIKLIEPFDPSSPAAGALRRGGGLHHLCFRVESLEQAKREMREKKLRVIAGPEPGEAFQNENILFVLAGNGVNVELIDTEKRAERIESAS